MTWVPAGTHLQKAFLAVSNAKPSNFPALKEFVIPCSSAKIHSSAASFNFDYKNSQYHPPSHSQHSIRRTQKKSSLQAKESNHGVKRASFIEKRKDKNYLDPLEMLKEDGDWSKEKFWDVIKSLRQSSRTSEVLQVFDLWKEREKSRINEENYEKIIGLLCEDRLTKAAVLALEQMKSHGLMPSPDLYNCIIHGFAITGGFHDALFYLKEMKDTGLKPNTETYDGLIQAYGKYGMYDEMGGCLKEMKSTGCLPDYITYNLLIREFAKAGLLEKIESTYQILVANRMNLQYLTLISMLEAYANFGILDKMEKVLKRVLKSKACLREDLIRKLAGVYIQNLMFSRLDDLGLDISSRTGSTDLVWCLRILSHACSLSRKGMYSIIEEMESSEVPWNVTIANTISLAYLNMKDFKNLEVLLTELPCRYVTPDIITVGILFDACSSGFNGTLVKHTWRRTGFFEDKVKMNTDPLVLIAFGKGQFLQDLKDMYSLMEPRVKEKRIGSYRHLIDLVVSYKKTQQAGIEQIEAKEFDVS